MFSCQLREQYNLHKEMLAFLCGDYTESIRDTVSIESKRSEDEMQLTEKLHTILVAMRLWETPVLIPNTMVKA